MRWTGGLGRALGGAVLLIQLWWIASAPLHEERSLAWAPLHEQLWYRVEASMDGRRLTSEEVTRRYQLSQLFVDPSRGEAWELNALARIQSVIRATEHRQPRRATVRVHFRRNGGGEETWDLPP